jgi:hypothetical protein
VLLRPGVSYYKGLKHSWTKTNKSLSLIGTNVPFYSDFQLSSALAKFGIAARRGFRSEELCITYPPIIVPGCKHITSTISFILYARVTGQVVLGHVRHRTKTGFIFTVGLFHANARRGSSALIRRRSNFILGPDFTIQAQAGRDYDNEDKR